MIVATSLLMALIKEDQIVAVHNLSGVIYNCESLEQGLASAWLEPAVQELCAKGWQVERVDGQVVDVTKERPVSPHS